VKTASLYDNFCKTGNYVIYDVIIRVQDGNCKKWLERILVLVRVLVWPKSDQRRLRKTLHKHTNKQTDRQTANRHYENNGHLAVNQLKTISKLLIIAPLKATLKQCKCSHGGKWYIIHSSASLPVHWVILSFSKPKILNFRLRPKFNLNG